MSALTRFVLLSLFCLVPLMLGEAEEAATPAAATPKEVKAGESKTPEVAKAKKPSNECLASEEVIEDLSVREQKLKDRETALNDREKELDSQSKAVHEELAKLEAVRAELQGVHAKALADREEKVNKLIETFETMSPKAAAGVINGVDDELAVTALSRLSTTKAGKILANMNPTKSAKLSELMAFGKVPGKEKAHGESVDRAPASSN